MAGVVEDSWGRLYIGTARGIDRLDVQTGSIKHYTTADGLPWATMNSALRDRTGALWFSFPTGLARLVPEPDPPPVPPPVLITGLRICRRSASDFCARRRRDCAGLSLNRTRIKFRLTSWRWDSARAKGLRYQYKLEGASQDWSPPQISAP